VPSDAAPTPPPPPDDDALGHRETALLLADLGRYDEAAGELAAGLAVRPGDAALLTTLARVHLVADQPAEALTAADRAVAAAPGTIGPMVARAMALADVRRFAEAAQIGVELLQRWPTDPYAMRTGAALLSETRNGQEALNAAWGAVSLSPTDAEAHLVLGVVSARLRLFDLAQRAYGEALDLDPALGEAQRDLGVVRLERRRWARALEELADAAVITPAPASPSPVVPVARPVGPVLDPSEDSTGTLRRAALYGANAVLVIALLAAFMASASGGASRVWAGTAGVILVVVLALWLPRALTEPVSTALARARRDDRLFAAALWATAAAPVLILAYALVGGLVPLVAALVLTGAAELVIVTRKL
jgi:tetratricopeptide (TPR) repeat protein